MCTVTIIKRAATHQGSPAWVRAVCNRDESRKRPLSLPPTLTRTGQQQSIHPTDPQSGGTWIGANDIGIAACLLNCNPNHTTQSPQPAITNRPSRGIIVPASLAQDSIQDAIEAAIEHARPPMPPFTVLIFTEDHYATLQWNGRSITTLQPTPLDRPIMLTSSGLGDSVVTPDRQSLFHSMFKPNADLETAQSQYHQQHSTNSPHTSVLMARADARTVSKTTLTLTQRAVSCEHVNLNDQLKPTASPSPITLRLRRQCINVQ